MVDESDLPSDFVTDRRKGRRRGEEGKGKRALAFFPPFPFLPF